MANTGGYDEIADVINRAASQQIATFQAGQGGDNNQSAPIPEPTPDPRYYNIGNLQLKRTPLQLERYLNQQNRLNRLQQFGDDYTKSPQYAEYLQATGRSLKNPYGNTGLFSRIFGLKNINYNLPPDQAQKLLDIGFDRYMNFQDQPELAQRRGFGSLFGGPVGEMTAQGEIRKQITPMSTGEMAARGVASLAGMGLPLSFIDGPNVSYAPMGASAYNPRLDPQVNKELQTGLLGGITNLLTGGSGTEIGERVGQGIDALKDRVSDFFNPVNEAIIQDQFNKPEQGIPSPAEEALYYGFGDYKK